MKRIFEKIVTILLILVVGVLYVWNVWASTGIYDLSDGLQHFSIARYAPAHPHLYLDHWGKPFYTLIASFFAPFGVKAVMLMNVGLTLVCGFLLFLLAKKLELKAAYTAPVLVAAGPAWFATTMGPLTEVLFATLFTLALFIFINRKYLFCALVVGILPFARSEAYFIVPLFMLAFLFLKQWKTLLMIALPAMVYSIVGYFVFDDFFWIINKNPYVGAKDIYGSGTFWHFYERMIRIFGVIVGYGGAAGAVLWWLGIRKKIWDEKSLTFAIASAALILVTLAHSYFWWQGLYGSLGLLRVLATVAPAYVLMLIYLFNQLLKNAPIWVVHVVLSGSAVYSSIALTHHGYFPKHPEEQELMAMKFAEWKTNSAYRDVKNVWYIFPPIGLYADIDQFDDYNSQPLYMLNRLMPSNQLRIGGLIVYDGARAPNEGRTSKESLFYDRHLRLVKDIQPPYPMVDMNGYNFEILAFEKFPDLENDTLAFEDFSKHRPIMEDRFGKIKKDDLDRKHLEMAGMTQWVELFKFWPEDAHWWHSDGFSIEVEYEGELQIIFYVNTDEHDTQMKTIDQGVFWMPYPAEKINWAQLGIYSPNENDPARVYQWCLKRVNKIELRN